MKETLKKLENLFGTAVPEEAIEIFWEVVVELAGILPNGWKVTHCSLVGCCSNAGGETLIGVTTPLYKTVAIDIEQLLAALRINRVPKGTFKFKIWRWITKAILKIFIRHEFRHANQFEYLAKHGVPWYAAYLAERNTPYMEQIMEKDARQFQYFGLAKSLESAMTPLVKMVRG